MVLVCILCLSLHRSYSFSNKNKWECGAKVRAPRLFVHAFLFLASSGLSLAVFISAAGLVFLSRQRAKLGVPSKLPFSPKSPPPPIPSPICSPFYYKILIPLLILFWGKSYFLNYPFHNLPLPQFPPEFAPLFTIKS